MVTSAIWIHRSAWQGQLDVTVHFCISFGKPVLHMFRQLVWRYFACQNYVSLKKAHHAHGMCMMGLRQRNIVPTGTGCLKLKSSDPTGILKRKDALGSIFQFFHSIAILEIIPRALLPGFNLPEFAVSLFFFVLRRVRKCDEWSRDLIFVHLTNGMPDEFQWCIRDNLAIFNGWVLSPRSML